MSEKFFYDNFFQAIIELHEQIQLEQWPAMIGPNGKRPCESWTNPKMFSNFYIGVYLKYIYLLRKIEDCYDQIIHVQIRDMVKKFLECILCRVVKVNFELTYYNLPPLDPSDKATTKPLDYVFMDDYLIDLKMEPSDLVLPIPRYFREDRSEARRKRNLLLEEGLKRVHQGKLLPEQDKTKDFFVADMSLEDAIKLDLKNKQGKFGQTNPNKSTYRY